MPSTRTPEPSAAGPDAPKLLVWWRELLVGHLSHPRLDMWYLDARFVPLPGEHAEAFTALAASLAPERVQRDPTQGTRVRLQEEGENVQTHALVLGLRTGDLSLRRVLREEAVQWLITHVR